ncbi:4-hydroxybenzoate polyprenyltransferase [Litoreibacter meonggei]|uniref:4-hydroxybenzoate polyprenyltransferase n=1 Tax=Litoreibacter meonggei TaxID=1049199 RepID=A0A497X5J2_9RHOB|nr:UbiA family prenyltransferase [Litoreibacter meonggei]RLJ60556.1 4-hydroxybenzoate polyprenyltransferase [Litoreibacter meonggei]
MTSKPLILDVDGTFLRTDMLLETFWSAMGCAPIQALKLVVTHFTDRAQLKSKLAELADCRVDLMPVDKNVAELAAQAAAQGHEVILASASDTSLVSALARHHGLSDRIFASDGMKNLKGEAKAEALVAAFGTRGFHYAGNEAVDMAVWKDADDVIMVQDHPAERANLAADGHAVTVLPGGWSWASLLKAMRPHQYVKNVLLLLPIIAAHNFGLSALLPVLLAMVSFSAAASCIYLVNDLLDIDADRMHPTKCRRPFASGALPIKVGMAAMFALAVIALGVAASLNMAFLAVVSVYMILSLAYSLKLKRMRWVDIATLASLYTLRVVAGAAAAEVYVTGYMLVFIFPVFVTLGCVKRLTELTLATSDERLPGRGYGRPDRSDLLNVAGLGMFGALLVFFLYTFTDQARSLYPTQWLLWVAMLPIGGWLFRMVSLGYKGKQDYDPIVFAMRDRHGISLILFTLTLMFYAAGLFQNAFGF